MFLFAEPPGGIDNSKVSVIKNGQTILRTNSDYGQLSDEMWHFLHGIYGGGPDVYVKHNQPTPTLTEVKVTEAGEPVTKVTESKQGKDTK